MNKSRMMRWAEHVSRVGKERNEHRIFVGKPEGKRPLRRTRCRWKDNTEMDLRETEWGGMDWIDLVQDKGNWRCLVNTVMNIRTP
jgi:hypothetical protein